MADAATPAAVAATSEKSRPINKWARRKRRRNNTKNGSETAQGTGNEASVQVEVSGSTSVVAVAVESGAESKEKNTVESSEKRSNPPETTHQSTPSTVSIVAPSADEQSQNPQNRLSTKSPGKLAEADRAVAENRKTTVQQQQNGNASKQVQHESKPAQSESSAEVHTITTFRPNHRQTYRPAMDPRQTAIKLDSSRTSEPMVQIVSRLLQGPFYVKLPGSRQSKIIRGPYRKRHSIIVPTVPPLHDLIYVRLPYAKQRTIRLRREASNGQPKAEIVAFYGPSRIVDEHKSSGTQDVGASQFSAEDAAVQTQSHLQTLNRPELVNHLPIKVKFPQPAGGKSDGSNSEEEADFDLTPTSSYDQLFKEDSPSELPKVKLPPASVYDGLVEKNTQPPPIVNLPAPPPAETEIQRTTSDTTTGPSPSPEPPQLMPITNEYRRTPDVMHQPRPTKLMNMAEIEDPLYRNSSEGQRRFNQRMRGYSNGYRGTRYDYQENAYIPQHQQQQYYYTATPPEKNMMQVPRGYAQYPSAMASPAYASLPMIVPQIPIAIPSPVPATVAQETNGMVYFYDSMQYYHGDASGAPSVPLVMAPSPDYGNVYYYQSPR
ncbi:hypothetical protein BZA70DRAFT_294665 [Myxozyma melibiosi]|uniref:Btz domain-containing protein n=1 Tax=Myxozyma melibiosi TaxID=54550 RepID=A0ABR1F993_9ASCO